MGQKGPICKAYVHWDRKGSSPMLINNQASSIMAAACRMVPGRM
jgi:hypothetical protein